MKVKSLLLLLSLLPMMAMADQSNVEINGIYYNLFSDTNEAEVTVNPDRYSGNVAIPSSITYGGQTYSVTSIGESAFKYGNLTAVDIPSSIKIINDRAFEACGLTNIHIPEGCVSIGTLAFNNCSALASVNIPSSVTTVGERPFNETAWYNNQPEGIVYLDNWVLGANCQVGNVEIREGTRGIVKRAFLNREDLISVTIPSSMKYICDLAFYGCFNLTSAKILGESTVIGRSVFTECYNLSDVTISEGTINIGYYCFCFCPLINIVIPSSVLSIDEGAFKGCSELTNVAISDGLLSIGDDAFESCSKLKSIAFPASLTYIGESAFSKCAELSDISFLGSSIKRIGKYAFRDIYYERKVNITDVAAWCAIEFVNEDANPLKGVLFVNGNQVTDLVIPNGVTSIGQYAFGVLGGLGLQSVIIPSSVTSIGNNAFHGALGWDTNSYIKSFIQEPFAVEDDVFAGLYSFPLYVPYGTKGKYETTAGWKNFVNIVEMEETSIDTIARNGEVTVKDNYSLNGQRVFSSAKGLNIIKMSDGTTKKVIVK